ncbi:hypothetical protein ALC53_11041, partial [Atta colombica]
DGRASARSIEARPVPPPRATAAATSPLHFRDSLLPRPPGDPPTANHSPLLSALATLSRAYSLRENESLSLSISLVLFNSLQLFGSLSLSLSLSRSFPFANAGLQLPLDGPGVSTALEED